MIFLQCFKFFVVDQPLSFISANSLILSTSEEADALFWLFPVAFACLWLFLPFQIFRYSIFESCWIKIEHGAAGFKMFLKASPKA